MFDDQVTPEQVIDNPWSILPELGGPFDVPPGWKLAMAMSDAGPDEAERNRPAAGGLTASDDWFEGMY